MLRIATQLYHQHIFLPCRPSKAEWRHCDRFLDTQGDWACTCMVMTSWLPSVPCFWQWRISSVLLHAVSSSLGCRVLTLHHCTLQHQPGPTTTLFLNSQLPPHVHVRTNASTTPNILPTPNLFSVLDWCARLVW